MVKISQRAGNILIVIIVILLNLWLMAGNQSGRYMNDYYGDQDPTERYEQYHQGN